MYRDRIREHGPKIARRHVGELLGIARRRWRTGLNGRRPTPLPERRLQHPTCRILPSTRGSRITQNQRGIEDRVRDTVDLSIVDTATGGVPAHIVSSADGTGYANMLG